MGKRDVRLVVNRVNPKLYSAMNLTVDDVMDMVGYPCWGWCRRIGTYLWQRFTIAHFCTTPGGAWRRRRSTGWQSGSRASLRLWRG